MSYVINAGDTAPALSLTATDAAPIDATGGWVLKVYRPDGSVLAVTPTVDASVPTAVVLTHQWQAGETDQSGVWAVEGEATDAFGERTSYPPTGALLFLVTPEGAGSYATIADARAAGAAGTDEQVLAALRSAETRVDRYTGDRWAPTPLTLVGRVGGDGRTVLLHRRVQTVTAVKPVGSATNLPMGAYTVLSSTLPGQVDAVVLGGYGSNVLIAGAEPWNGGWAGFLDRASITGHVEVTGVFGHPTAPPEVRDATALVAAWLTTLTASGAGPALTTPTVDDEGNSLTITTTPADQAQSRGTGVPAADQLLSGLVRRRVRLAG